MALGQLKKISTNPELKEAVLIDSFEFHSLKNVRIESLKSLKPLLEESVPSSSVIAFDSLQTATKELLQATFIKLNRDSSGKEILAELRLQGFSLP
jgi:hypothetical protein